jgi:hypothetical protein
LNVLSTNLHGFVINTKLISLWSSVRSRALSSVYRSIPSFSHLKKFFKSEVISNFISNYKAPDYLNFSCYLGNEKFESLEKYIFNKSVSDDAKDINKKYNKLKTYFQLLPFAGLESIKIRKEILGLNNKPFQPRSFNIYKNFSNGLSIVNKMVRSKVPNKFDLFNIDYKKNLDEINKYLPVKVSSVSRIVSYNPPDRTYMQKDKHVFSLFMRFFREADLCKDIRNRIEKQISEKDYVVLPGSFKYTQRLLDILGEEPEKVRFSYKDMVIGVNNFKHLLPSNLTKLKLPESWSCKSIKINKDSYSGYMSSKLFGRFKGNVIVESGELAAAYYDRIIFGKSFCFDVFAWSLGGREKRASISSKGEVLTRDVWMIEDLLNRIVNPIHDTFLDIIKEQDHNCPLFLGKTITEGQSYDYIKTYVHGQVEFDKNQFTDGGWIIPIDYSKFSLRIYEELIVMAMTIFSSYFNMRDSSVKKLMVFITNSVVNKNLVLPESGLTYQFTKGVPSGHSLTSILNTLVNFIIVSTALSKINLTEKERFSIRFLCAGDDTLIYVPFSIKLKDLDRVFKMSGMKMDLPSDVAVLNGCQHVKHMPVFLKRCFKDYDRPVVWHESSLFENLISPNKSRDHLTLKGLYEEKERIYGMLKHAPFNEDHNILFYKYIRYLEGLIRMFRTEEGHKIYSAEFLGDVSKMIKRRGRANSYKEQYLKIRFTAPENLPEEEFSRIPSYVFRSDEIVKKTGPPIKNTDMIELLGYNNDFELLEVPKIINDSINVKIDFSSEE